MHARSFVFALTAALALGPVSVTMSADASVARVAAKTAASKDFPAVSVTDVKTGKAYSLSGLATLNRPVLMWFWSPT